MRENWRRTDTTVCENLGERVDVYDNMAAAVEGTPRRVRALLSSFLHTSDKEEELR